jgi:hypothetical protein
MQHYYVKTFSDGVLTGIQYVTASSAAAAVETVCGPGLQRHGAAWQVAALVDPGRGGEKKYFYRPATEAS